jgi:hypothetical protein
MVKFQLGSQKLNYGCLKRQDCAMFQERSALVRKIPAAPLLSDGLRQLKIPQKNTLLRALPPLQSLEPIRRGRGDDSKTPVTSSHGDEGVDSGGGGLKPHPPSSLVVPSS